MNLKRALILLLCSWLSLNVTAGTLAGCDFVDKALGGINFSSASLAAINVNTAEQASAHKHCDEMKNVTKTAVSESHHVHADCNSCKTHCSSASLIIGVDTSVSFERSKEKFVSIKNPLKESIVLDLPQRPPQSIS